MKASIHIKGIPISTKDAINIARFIRGKELKITISKLNTILDKKSSLPHLKYPGSTPHKKGKVMAGSYPLKAIKEMLKLLNSVEANARNKGMIAPFIINHIKADKGELQWHYGRQRRHRRKNTYVEITLIEKSPKPKEEKARGKKETGAVALDKEKKITGKEKK
ncbi:MAG: 50S ribosomal protein L22 [Nanoarchaeota archaeon]|nr:50S ribosomal protein L22 [Nanoarchaeota archaeon]